MRFCHFLSQEKTPDKRANKKTDKPHYIGPNFVSPHEVTKKAKKKNKQKKKQPTTTIKTKTNIINQSN